jgi:hypothetical protein
MVLRRPEPEVAEFERTIVSEAVASGATDQMLVLDLAVRSAMGTLGPAGGGISRVSVDPMGVVRLRPDRDVEPPVGWLSEGGEWVLANATASPGGAGVFPCPTLCQVGTTSDGQEVFVDLEHIGGLTVVGDDADRVVAGMAVGLAVSPFADRCPIIHVGEDGFSLGSFGSIRSVRPSDLPSEWTAATHPLPLDTPSAAAIRCRGDDAWDPLVIVSTGGPLEWPGRETAQVTPVTLVAASDLPGSGAALVSIGTGWWSLDTGDPDHPDIVVRPAMLDRSEVVQVDGLLAGPTAVTVTDGAASTAEHVEMDRPEVVVRLLGDVRVESADGSEVAFERAKSVELLAWLVTHRERPTRARARSALWETEVRAATFSNVVSDARRTLGRVAPLGGEREWIARTLTEELALDPSLLSDADILREARVRAGTLQAVQAVEVLRPALALVEGLPFSGSAFTWPDPEGITSELVVLATGAAAEMARHCLAMGDLAGVVWATGQGLKVLPGHEELIALRLRARAATGDMAGVRQEWASYERVLADEWTGGEPAPELIDLRRELLTARRGG